MYRAAILLVLSACGTTRVIEPIVVIDPAQIDLGLVRGGSLVQRSTTIADVAEGGSALRLDALRLEGVGAEWVEVSPIVPLPTELRSPLPVNLTLAGVPVDAELGPYRLTLIGEATGANGPVQVRGVVTFEVKTCDEDLDGVLALVCGGTDCDDTDPARRPGLSEVCNEIDDDCNGLIDDAPDLDGDGFGLCEDCDDGDFRVNPAGIETCNGIDDDCDGFLPADEADNDRDGVPVCADDCDDRDPTRSPRAPELCNGRDDNCNLIIDDVEDFDGDGFDLCEDCDDRQAFVYPGAEEICNGRDDDCDGEILDFERDADGDGVAICRGDCDDLDASVSPLAEEVCNGRDDTCAGDIDEDGACPCERRTFDGGLYQFCDDGKSWTDAQAQCAAWGYHMITINDGREDRAAYRAATGVDGSRRWWIGLNDRAVEDVWVWEDGSPVTYTRWNPAEPNDSGAGEDCGQINRYSDGTWNDEPCGNVLPYICEL